MRLGLIALVGVACSGGGGVTDGGVVDVVVPDVAIDDAAVPDVTPVPLDAGGPLGTWRIVAEEKPTTTDDGGITIVTRTDEGDIRVNGLLTVARDELAASQVHVTRGRFSNDGELFQQITTADIHATSFELAAGGDLPFSTDAGTLGVVLGDMTLRYEPLVHVPSTTISVTGIVPSGFEVDFLHPRVALVFLVRDDLDGVMISADPRDDHALDFSSGLFAPIDLSRTAGARGTERVTFGSPQVAISLALVVVYDDVNDNQQLDVLFGSCDALEDCVRGVSPVVLGYRAGSSPELAASPYAYLLASWSRALPVSDVRETEARLGVVSLDPTVEVPFDVVVTDTPPAAIPAFSF
jgi:hypothetical protein